VTHKTAEILSSPQAPWSYYYIHGHRVRIIVTMAVSVAVCEIFSVKEWRDFENQVRGRSRSLKMAPFDRHNATFYWSAIVNKALSCTIFEFFDVK